MTTTRSYRLNRLALSLELYESRIRRATNEALVAGASIDRSAPGVAPIEPGTLMTLFDASPATAWAALSGLTQPQLINQAIEVACWLEQAGVVAPWSGILQRWETRLAEQAQQAA